MTKSSGKQLSGICCAGTISDIESSIFWIGHVTTELATLAQACAPTARNPQPHESTTPHEQIVRDAQRRHIGTVPVESPQHVQRLIALALDASRVRAPE